jgi:hypothetical protein
MVVFSSDDCEMPPEDGVATFAEGERWYILAPNARVAIPGGTEIALSHSWSLRISSRVPVRGRTCGGAKGPIGMEAHGNPPDGRCIQTSERRARGNGVADCTYEAGRAWRPGMPKRARSASKTGRG